MSSVQPLDPAQKCPSRVSVFWLGALVLLLAFKLVCALTGYPPTWCDEVVYTEPAVNFVNEGVFASPGLAQQLELTGGGGFDQHSFLNVPLAGYARVAIYKLVGTEQSGRRITDWIFLVLATGALFFALRQWCALEISVFCTIPFVLHKTVGNDQGRPDLLSLTFGLLAFAILSRQLRPEIKDLAAKGRTWTALLVGFLIGLSGLTHQFGGVFWAFIIVVVKVTQEGRALGWLTLTRWAAFVGVGGLAGISLWLPQIFHAPDVWAMQFSHMLNLKHHLLKSFPGSLSETVQDTVFRNPCLFLVLIAGLAIKRKKRSITDIRLVLIGCLIVLAIWRCYSFEPYLQAYSIHFWAVICILLGLAAGDLIEYAQDRFPTKRPARIANTLLGVVLLGGMMSLYTPFIEVFMLSSAKVRADASQLLHSSISERDRVLAGPAWYFDVPSTNKSVWVWTEKIDLNDYDAVVTSYPSKQSAPAFRERDQYIDCFTPEQSQVFLKNFELVAGVTPSSTNTNASLAGFDDCISAVARRLGMSNHHAPQIGGCYIYRNLHPAQTIK